ncbi:hypothetical protein GX408_08245 [bacterium]|nr:hypothetical protein [bacterium]
MVTLGKNPWLIQRPAVRIQATALVLHFAFMQKKNPFYLDNPAAFVYININNDY